MITSIVTLITSRYILQTLTKHLSIRLAWHDSGWNGHVCKDPRSNIYCTGNYSLLSTRLQRRIDLDQEEKFKGMSIKEISKTGYVPPCYWSINLQGDANCTIQDKHPFADLDPNFADIPPLEHKIDPFTIFSWPFSIGYGKKPEISRYVDFSTS